MLSFCALFPSEHVLVFNRFSGICQSLVLLLTQSEALGAAQNLSALLLFLCKTKVILIVRKD